MDLDIRKLLWVLPIMISHGAACSGSPGATGGGPWLPSNSNVAEIEANLRMPSKAFPLNTYIRYFTGEVAGGRHIVVGTFVHDANNAGARIVEREQMPSIFDGGCAIVNLKYDVERKEVLALFCNGEA